MTPGEPDTAAELQRVLDGLRRGNPPDARRPCWLSVRPAGVGQRWRRVSRHEGFEVAVDSATSPVFEADPGALVRVAQGRELLWLGVVVSPGRAEPAPPAPVGGAAGWTSWLDAWDGPQAEAGWMVRQCDRLPRREVVLALAACVDTVVGLAGSGAPVLRRVLRVLRSWAAGRASDAERLEATLDARSDRARVTSLGSNRVGAAAYETSSAVDQLVGYAAGNDDEPASVVRSVVWATRWAARDAGSLPPYVGPFDLATDRALAPRVRGVIPLGDVLLAKARAGA